MQCAYANRCVFFQETKSGALKKTSRYRSRSLSASSTDSYSSGEKQIHLRNMFGSCSLYFFVFHILQHRIRAAALRTMMYRHVKKPKRIPMADRISVSEA